jgi:hypothetical protein
MCLYATHGTSENRKLNGISIRSKAKVMLVR